MHAQHTTTPTYSAGDVSARSGNQAFLVIALVALGAVLGHTRHTARGRAGGACSKGKAIGVVALRTEIETRRRKCNAGQARMSHAFVKNVAFLFNIYLFSSILNVWSGMCPRSKCMAEEARFYTRKFTLLVKMCYVF